MADDGKLYIIITDKPEVQTTETVTETTITTEKKSEIKKTGSGGSEGNLAYSFAVHQFYDFVKNTAIEIANWSVGNIGNFTGNYSMQSEITKSVSNLSKISGIAMAIGTGAATGGPIGALVAGTIAVAGTGISIALQDKANSFRVKRQNYEIAQLRELSGLNPLTNGGRI